MINKVVCTIFNYNWTNYYCIKNIIKCAQNNTNLVPPIINAIKSNCTLGEISDSLRGVFGEYI